MNTHLLATNELFCHLLVVRLVSLDRLNTAGGLCATLRNRLQYAMSKVMLDDRECSLFDFCKQIPLPEDHPLYKELENGFPPPFYLYAEGKWASEESVSMQANDILTFSLVLIGHTISKRLTEITEALHKMCVLGMGYPTTQLELIDICEQHPQNGSRILVIGTRILSSSLELPIQLSDYLDNDTNYDQISIHLQSPLCLVKPKRRRVGLSGYQERCNGFPSFYQLIRSAAFRYAKLSILYADNLGDKYYNAVYENIDKWVDKASQLVLTEVDIKKICIKNSPQNKIPEQIPFEGYVGEMTYRGDYSIYLPLLLYMQCLGVGHELTYGFGKYEIECKEA